MIQVGILGRILLESIEKAIEGMLSMIQGDQKSSSGSFTTEPAADHAMSRFKQ